MADRMQWMRTGCINVKKIPVLFAFVLGLGLAAGAYAQTAGQDLKDAGHETKEATKDAAKGTGQAVKTGAHKTKRAAKRTTHAAAQGVEKGADKVEDKTR